MHKGIFRMNHSSTIVYQKVLRPKCLTGVALGIGIVSTCEKTTREILPIGTKALFFVWKYICHEGIILPTSLTSNFEFYASNYALVSTFEY